MSKAQIDIAIKVLVELSGLVDRKARHHEFVEASSRFYTMVPHTFGHKAPPVIDTAEQIAKEMKMLEHLANIQLTYSILNDTDDNANPFDNLYRKLNADIEGLCSRSGHLFHICSMSDIYVSYALLSQFSAKIRRSFRRSEGI